MSIHSELGQVVGDITKIKVVRHRVQVWVVKPHTSRSINVAASSANSILNVHLEPPFLTPKTVVHRIILQSLPELMEEGQVLIVQSTIIQVPKESRIPLSQVSQGGWRRL